MLSDSDEGFELLLPSSSSGKNSGSGRKGDDDEKKKGVNYGGTRVRKGSDGVLWLY